MFTKLNGNLKDSTVLTKASWKILWRDKTLLVFPILSGLTVLLIIAYFLISLMLYIHYEGVSINHMSGSSSILGSSVAIDVSQKDGSHTFLLDFTNPLFYFGFFILFYLIGYFIIFFFNSALIKCVLDRLEGKPLSLSSGFQSAWNHKKQLFIWSLISASIGVILNFIGNKTKLAGKISVILFGIAWNVITYFMLPVLVFEDNGIKQGINRSAHIFRNIYGEEILGNLEIWMYLGSFKYILFMFFLLLGGFAGKIIDSNLGGLNGLLIGGLIGIVSVIIINFIQSLTNEVYRTVLYSYGVTGMLPEDFPKDMIPALKKI